MKKIILLAILSLLCSVSVFAYKLNSDTVFSGDGVTLRMNSDGSCQVLSAETGNLRGTYDITSSSQVEPGCSMVNVVFNFNGERVYGQFMWPLQQGLMINFDGVLLQQAR